MQLARIQIRVGGSSNTIVNRSAVTPAEMMLLAFIHGEGAFASAVYQGEEDRSSIDEIERLRARYGRNKNGVDGLMQLFPGHAPQLPESFSDTPHVVEDADDSPKKVRRTRKTAEAKEVPQDEVDALLNGENE
jgi:hypothetical protein